MVAENEIAVGKKFRRLSRFVLFLMIINFENRQIELIYTRSGAKQQRKWKQKITNSINDSGSSGYSLWRCGSSFVFIIAQKIYFYRSSKDARQLNCCRYFLGFCLFWKFYRLFSMMIMFWTVSYLIKMKFWLSFLLWLCIESSNKWLCLRHCHSSKLFDHSRETNICIFAFYVCFLCLLVWKISRD